MLLRIAPKLVLAGILALSVTGCQSTLFVRSNAYSALQQIHSTAMSHLDQEIASIGNRIAAIDNKTDKLEQLVAQTGQWINDKRETDYEVPCG